MAPPAAISAREPPAPHEMLADSASWGPERHPQVEAVGRMRRNTGILQQLRNCSVAFGVVGSRTTDVVADCIVGEQRVSKALKQMAHPRRSRAQAQRETCRRFGVRRGDRQAHVGAEEFRHRPDEGPAFVIGSDDRVEGALGEEGEVVVLHDENIRVRGELGAQRGCPRC